MVRVPKVKEKKRLHVKMFCVNEKGNTKFRWYRVDYIISDGYIQPRFVISDPIFIIDWGSKELYVSTGKEPGRRKMLTDSEAKQLNSELGWDKIV